MFTEIKAIRSLAAPSPTVMRVLKFPADITKITEIGIMVSFYNV